MCHGSDGHLFDERIDRIEGRAAESDPILGVYISAAHEFVIELGASGVNGDLLLLRVRQGRGIVSGAFKRKNTCDTDGGN